MNMRVYRKVMAWICLIAVVFVMQIPSAMATSGTKAQSAETASTSLYASATALTAYANHIVGSNGNDKHTSGKLTELNNTGNAGAVLGFGDEKQGFNGFLGANVAKNMTAYSYSSLVVADNNAHVYKYARYGHLLHDLGLDDTGSGVSQGRTIGGWCFKGLYMAGMALPQMFGFIVKGLRYLNPFYYLVGGSVSGGGNLPSPATDANGVVIGVNSAATVAFDLSSAGPAAGGNVPSLLSELAGQVRYVYAWILNYVSLWIVIPLLIALLIFTLTMSRSTYGRGSKVLTFFKRFAFIMVGVPLLAGVYTAALDIAEDALVQQPAASRVMASSFVDFESWAVRGRLRLPASVSFESAADGSTATNTTGASGSGSATGEGFRALRSGAYRINVALGVISESNWVTNSTDPYTAGIYDQAGGLKSENASTDSQSYINDMLSRYASSNYYEAAAWSSYVNSIIKRDFASSMGHSAATGNASSNTGTVYAMYDATDEATDWEDRSDSDNSKIFSGGSYNGGAWASKNFNIFKNGQNFGGSVSPSSAVRSKIKFSGSGSTYVSSPSMTTAGWLSSASMYNYLSSAFTDTAIEVYSPEVSTSAYTKQAHYSVNLIGGPTFKILFGLNVFALIGVFTIIGFVYGIGMLINNIRRGISLLFQVPVAMLGVLKSIVQVVVYTIVMVAEIVTTSLLYAGICDIIISIATLIESSVGTALGDPGTAIIGGLTAAVGTGDMSLMLYESIAVVGFGLILATLLVALIGRGGMKYRRQVMIAVEFFWCRLYRLATDPALLPAYDAMVAKRSSLYVYSELSEKVGSMYNSASDAIAETISDEHSIATVATKGV